MRTIKDVVQSLREKRQVVGGASHLDKGKTRLELIPVKPLAMLGRIYEWGTSHKYEENNWMAGMKWTQLIGSAMRHLESFRGGEDNDPESGLPHLSHATWNLMTLLEYQMSQLGEDDRIFQLEDQDYQDIGRITPEVDRIETSTAAVKKRVGRPLKGR